MNGWARRDVSFLRPLLVLALVATVGAFGLVGSASAERGFASISHTRHAVSSVAATAASVATGDAADGPRATFDSETASLDAPLPDLTSAIVVSSASAFESAVADAQAGQTIEVLGGVRIGGSFGGFNRVIKGGTVNVVFDPGAGFSGMGGRNNPAVFIKGSGGWRVWGGSISNPDGNGILVYAMPGPFTWTGEPDRVWRGPRTDPGSVEPFFLIQAAASMG